MKTRMVGWVLCAVLFGCGSWGLAQPDPQAKLKGVVKKYMEMEGDPVPGVVVEIAEFVNREKTYVTLAETQIINVLKNAGVAVLAKGKPEFIIYGAVESNWSGQAHAYGTSAFVYEAAITLKVIDTRKGTVVDTVSAQVRKVNPSPEKAAREAMVEVGNSAGKKVVTVLKDTAKTVE
ncbi:MAG: hypothetical protein GXP25_12490 [Planctomycetes bacterium]|nr:hypothetical protein [Planctomycetota bacterium]